MCKEPRQCAGFFILGHTVDKLLNLSSQRDSIATSLAIIARAVQEIANPGQDHAPDESPAETAYLDD